jgi:hypothetical protein
VRTTSRGGAADGGTVHGGTVHGGTVHGGPGRQPTAVRAAGSTAARNVRPSVAWAVGSIAARAVCSTVARAARPTEARAVRPSAAGAVRPAAFTAATGASVGRIACLAGRPAASRPGILKFTKPTPAPPKPSYGRSPVRPRGFTQSRTAHKRPESDHERTHGAKPCCGSTLDVRTPSGVPRKPGRTHARAKPCFATTTHNARAAPHAPTTTTNPRTGEALFGGPTHGARTNAAPRAEHSAWPPVWDGAS